MAYLVYSFLQLSNKTCNLNDGRLGRRLDDLESRPPMLPIMSIKGPDGIYFMNLDQKLVYLPTDTRASSETLGLNLRHSRYMLNPS
jgi:hypothetical protein